MKSVSARVVWLLAAAASLSATTATAQGIPGAIPDPSSYAGSMELQRREAESARQNAPQPQQSYAPSSSGGGGSYGPSQPAAPQIDWARRPPLAAARNPLLGRWQPKKIDSAAIADEVGLGGFGKVLGGFLGDVIQGDCDGTFGDQVVEYNASGMISTGLNGRPTVTPLAYRADGNDVIAVRGDGGVFRFKFDNRNTITASPPGCPMSRVGGVAAASLNTGAPGPGVRPAPPPVATNSTLTFDVGVAAPGRFNPLADANIYVVTADPDQALARAGFGAAPVETWLKTCKTNNQACVAGFQAVTAGAIGNVRTDAAGKAMLRSVPQGRYFLFGMVAYQGKSLIWHYPIDIRPGANGAFLDQTTATAG